jgi:hypothetical protein
MSDVTIPDDVMATALKLANENCGADASFCVGAFARASLAERERAAKVAEAVAQDCRDFGAKAQRRQQKMASNAQAFVADRIAQAIRSSHD